MVDVPPNPPDACWKLSSQAELHWKSWGDEFVVFNSQSGDTHLLDLVAREGLLCLQEAALSSAEMSRQLAQRLEVENDSTLLKYTERLIVKFDTLGLLERENP